MYRRASDARNRVLEKVATQTAATDTSQPHLDVFMHQYFRTVAVEDLRERTPADLAGAAISHLQMAAKRTPGTPLIRVFNPSRETAGFECRHTIVEIINDDMPFLVDSTSMVLNRQGLLIHLTIHPVVRVVRDGRGVLQKVLGPDEDDPRAVKESFLYFEVNRVTDDKRLKRVKELIASTLDDVSAATRDWRAMRKKILGICDEIEANPPPLQSETVDEGVALLRWMEDNHFTFLGYREYELVREDDRDMLRVLPETGLGILSPNRKHTGPVQPPLILAEAIRKQARSRELLVITKANSPSTVHRPSYLDYVGVKKFDNAGRVIGEMRFLGLFTSVAYSLSAREIPLLRHKVARIIEQSNLSPNSHAGKALIHILDTFPRDELFQSSVEDLTRTVSGIFNLQERQRVRLFIRRDAFRRFVSCLVYVPRDKYNTQIRERIQNILKASFHGTSVESSVALSESVLARVHVIVRTGDEGIPVVNVRSVENRIIDAVRTWHDHLMDALLERFDEAHSLALADKYGQRMPAAYMDDVAPKAATYDIERIAALATGNEDLLMSLYRPKSFPESRLRFKVFHRDTPIPLSDALPMLENMGLKVIGERPYEVNLDTGLTIWIHDFEMEHPQGRAVDPRQVNENFQGVFSRTWYGVVENDGFNRLILEAGLDWCQARMLRAYARYLLQTRIPFSQHYIEEALSNHPHIARMLVELFEARFDPDIGERRRKRRTTSSEQTIHDALDDVASLDDDRILRFYVAVVGATVRTNYFQTVAEDRKKSYLSFKFDPRKITHLPRPRPQFEIFVYSPRVEGVHLRGGKVARGGLRWSDRREDFRTEVLGLMKAQMVKNAVIVPMGAKGGFVPKRLPLGDRDAVMEEVVACYKQFIRGLLDLTDNLAEDRVVPPTRVVRYDENDPYLVVAADKGTATFSDTANGVAAEYDFWLGDAFASGGSAGYDHKKMGITARGAWESVKRHFREIGVDIQDEPFSVAGIGDMGGDVFGNGMLQSRHTRLLAAFNHLHIFLDPNPDPEQSHLERKRLFHLPRSTWMDYNQEYISAGGGVYARSEKRISLSPEVQRLLNIQATSMTPEQVVKAILRMPVDLLWNGGIGTYVKAESENNLDVGDRANDNLRINGSELRCKVVGEGGNLGLTQRGRIEYALHGGRVNTDFIDNSGGVDTSDREVNIKILLNQIARTKSVTKARRDRLLSAMTDEVTGLVLRDNYLQTQAISLMETQARERLNEHWHLIRSLEHHGGLNRTLEFIPTDEDIEDRRRTNSGLMRPEMAVLLAYAKISLYDDMIASDVPEDPYLANELARYFPAPLQRRYQDAMSQHPLRREIIATTITNSIVNRMGPTFVERMEEETGAEVAAVARAYTIARESFDMHSLWAEIESLDNAVHANVQYSMMFETTRLLKQVTRWLLEKKPRDLEIETCVADYRPGVGKLQREMRRLLISDELKRFQETSELYLNIGVPERLSQRVAGLQPIRPALDIVEVAQRTGRDVGYVAQVYFRLGTGLSINWLRDQIEDLAVEGHWQATARGTLRENLYSLQRGLTAQIITANGDASPNETVLDWFEVGKHRIAHAQHTLTEMRHAGVTDFATLSVAVQEIRKLAEHP